MKRGLIEDRREGRSNSSFVAIELPLFEAALKIHNVQRLSLLKLAFKCVLRLYTSSSSAREGYRDDQLSSPVISLNLRASNLNLFGLKTALQRVAKTIRYYCL